MGTQSATPAPSEIRKLLLTSIVPSKTNRKLTNAAVEEMAASIKKEGVLQPIITRVAAGEKEVYEIVCGECRWRGAQVAGLETIPAIVGTYTDEEAQLIQIVENLHRSNPSAMEEASALGHLKNLLGKNATIEQIAAQVGKDASHVAQRLKLLDLIPEAQKALRADHIGTGHALLMAPLQAEQQKVVLKWMIYKEESDANGAFVNCVPSCHSARAVRAFIEREFMLALDKAPFDIHNAKLNQHMGACDNCPHNTANTASLFPDIKGATCTQPDCYFGKVRADIEVKVEVVAKEDGRKPYRLGVCHGYKENEGKSRIPVDGYLATQDYDDGPRWVEKGNECKATRTAILVFRGTSARLGENIKAKIGDTALVCPDPKCEKHGHRTSYGISGTRTPLKGMAFVNRKSANMTKSRPQRLRWAIFKALASELLKKPSPIPGVPSVESLTMLAAEKASVHLIYDAARDAAKALGFEKPKKQERFTSRPDWEKLIADHFKGNPWAWLMAINAAEDIRSDHKKPENSNLFKIAKVYKVDIGKLADEINKADKELISKMSERVKSREAAEKKKQPRKSRAAKRHSIAGGICRYCKCTDDKACTPPCSWVDEAETICSSLSCVEKAIAEGVIKKRKK